MNLLICQKIIAHLSVHDICHVCRVGGGLGRTMTKVLTSFTRKNYGMQSLFRDAFKGNKLYVNGAASSVIEDHNLSVEQKKKLIFFLKEQDKFVWSDPIKSACYQKDMVLVKLLIAESINQYVDWEHPMLGATSAGKEFVDIILLRIEADNYRTKSDLLIGHTGYNPEMFEYLVKRLKKIGFELTIDYPLQIACRTLDLNIVKSIIEISTKHQLPINFDNAILIAKTPGMEDILKFLKEVSSQSKSLTEDFINFADPKHSLTKTEMEICGLMVERIIERKKPNSLNELVIEICRNYRYNLLLFIVGRIYARGFTLDWDYINTKLRGISEQKCKEFEYLKAIFEWKN